MVDDAPQRPKSRKLWLGTAFLIVVAVWAFYPSASVTYRLTLRTDVAGQQTSASGLIHVAFFKVPRFLGATSVMDIGVTGQAVYVDLGDRGLLVALLGGSRDLSSAPEYVIPEAFGLKNASDDLSRINSLEGSRVLRGKLLPPLVYFSNPLGPSTARLLAVDDLPFPFAPQTKVLGADIEIVKSTWLNSWFGSGSHQGASIEDKLPWLKDASQQAVFWKALVASGWQRSATVTTMFIRR